MLFRSRHVLAATALHIVLFVLIVSGIRCTPKMQPPPVIEALVVTGQNKAGKLKTEPPAPPKAAPTPEPPKPVEPPPPEPPTPEPPEPPPPEPPKPEPPKPEPPKPDPVIEKKKVEEAKRKEEAERVKREQEVKRQAEIQRQKADEDKKKKEEQDAKRKVEEDEKKRKAEEEKKRVEEEKRKAAEEKRKAEEERKRKEDEARRLRELLESSAQAEEEERAEAARIGEVKKDWGLLLGEHIARRWLRPPGLPQGLRCTAQVDILPNGEVISVKIIVSSGNPAFDASVETAIYKSSPVPLPTDPKAFERTLKPVFTPELLEQLQR